jgi:hypothetical protein
MHATGWSRRAALASLALVAFWGARAEAQFGLFPGANAYQNAVVGRAIGTPAFGNAALSTGGFIPNPYATAGAAAAAAAMVNNPFTNPAFDAIAATPGYQNPYAPYGWGDPVSGYLRGVADVTTANAQWEVTIQRARMLNEEALRMQLGTRRAVIEQARWERMNTPGAEDIRLAEMAMSLARSRRNPPVGEIWSGKALNDLLAYLIDQQGRGNKGPLVALDEDLLKKINVTDGTGGNVGLLRDGGKITWWPQILQGKDFATLREKLDKKLPDAVNTLKFGQPVEKGTLDDIKAAVREARKELDNNIARLLPSDYLEATRFLNQLDESIRALQNPNASNYFTGKWAAKANNVNELVKQMTDTGLRFAPATPGDEAAYRVLHNALVSYDAGMPALTTQPMPMPR